MERNKKKKSVLVMLSAENLQLIYRHKTDGQGIPGTINRRKDMYCG